MQCSNVNGYGSYVFIRIMIIGASDPYVEVVLMPEDKIKIKAVKTKTIKANVNPYYGKEFKM